jgi:hypothetical protein
LILSSVLARVQKVKECQNQEAEAYS